MADTAAYLSDHVLPEVPIRQWVLTLPLRIRYLIAFDKKMCRSIKRIFISALTTWLRRKARKFGLADGHIGAVIFLQRWGGALNLNPHFHALVLDGIYIRTSQDEDPVFQALPAPDDEEMARLIIKIRENVVKLLS
jgi:hypothetical protein